ncbi:MAG: hypothetical protein OXD30_04445 [Bryobacterales bacterium]|nr:hypothetical protein [Bryobacterales bacterium]
MKHKLMQAMRERDGSQRLHGIAARDGADLGGDSRGGKRGRGVASKTAFVAAAQVSAERHLGRLRLSPGGWLASDPLPSAVRAVARCLD